MPDSLVVSRGRGAAGRRLARRGAAMAVALAMAGSVGVGGAHGATAALPSPEADPVADAPPGPTRFVPEEMRDTALGSAWRASSDRIVMVRGDATGLHVLAAKEAEGYAWKTAATLSEIGFETDRWVGNACVTGDGKRAVVTYAPREFTNEPELFQRGAFAAVVGLDDGSVRKLAIRATLAYHSPGCGSADDAVLTQQRGGLAPEDGGFRSRAFVIDAANGAVKTPVEVPGQITSAVPTGQGIVAAAGRNVVRIASDGTQSIVSTATSSPYGIKVGRHGRVLFMEHENGQARVRAVRIGGTSAPAVTIATGALTEVDLARGAAGQVFIVGQARETSRVPGVKLVPAPAQSDLSDHGRLAVLPETRPATPAGLAAASRPSAAVQQALTLPAGEPGVPGSVSFTAKHLGSLQEIPFTFALGSTGTSADGPRPLNEAGTDGPLTASSTETAAVAAATATCAVPRNDPRSQVYQPTPRQVEWAADQAVVENLKTANGRPANWKQSGMPAYYPQGLFPPRKLSGGGRIHVQVLLGILAQESNLWQASRHALSGVTGNPLVGSYYGHRPSSNGEDEASDWTIDFADADCGYGVSQITDGMRKAGYEREGENALAPLQQRAAALDYVANISAGMQVLEDKWNQTRGAGLVHSNGDPKWLENWFFAIWAYNSGFHPYKDAITPWGVGWFNNPANGDYPPNRTFFNQRPSDAAEPQNWPYPEKVIGFAAYSMSTLDGPGFRAAWWPAEVYRMQAKPPVYTFCTVDNQCSSNYRNPLSTTENNLDYCTRADRQCWWNKPVTFNDCTKNYCGNELHRFNTTYPEQPDGTNYPPNCSTAGLPAGARIVDNQPDSVPSVRSGCTRTWNSAGTFQLSYPTQSAEVDLHQIGGGFGGHFSFAHTRKADQPRGAAGSMKVTGTWTFSAAYQGWARVFVHMPDHGAHTQQAAYNISTGTRTVTRYALQRTLAHKWVSLGAIQFNGTPRISLSSQTFDGRGVEDVAWDAVALEPLPGKPRHMVVALGDSYSSGEGASDPTGGDDYYRETDNNGHLDEHMGRNACHRSPHAWSRRGTLADNAAATIGARADAWDQTLDFQFHACSGARTHNVLADETRRTGEPEVNPLGKAPQGQYGEVSQIDKGYLDEHTTLVALSMGGNDARFSDIVKSCITPRPDAKSCPDVALGDETEPASTTVPRNIDGKVRESLEQMLRAIRARAPNAHIVLMGYPLLFENGGQCVVGVHAGEAAWMNDEGKHMTAMTAALVGSVRTVLGAPIPVTFADPADEFAGQAVCGNPETIHNIVSDTTEGDQPKHLGLVPPSAQSFHPKIPGTAHYADAFNDALRAAGF